jgi:hypothetical protein
LAESGYTGEPVICLVAQDYPDFKAWGEVTLDLLKRLGMRVDFVAADWGTVVARRAQRLPPGQGGWHMFLGSHSGTLGINPATNYPIRANGDGAWFGWPSASQVEAEVAAWFEAKTLDDERAIARRLNKAALDHVVYAPVGFYLHHQAWRRAAPDFPAPRAAPGRLDHPVSAVVTQGPFFWIADGFIDQNSVQDACYTATLSDYHQQGCSTLYTESVKQQ